LASIICLLKLKWSGNNQRKQITVLHSLLHF
jgi:hypothetical protein